MKGNLYKRIIQEIQRREESKLESGKIERLKDCKTDFDVELWLRSRTSDYDLDFDRLQDFELDSDLNFETRKTRWKQVADLIELKVLILLITLIY